MTKLMIDDDHPLYREGVASVLCHRMPGAEVIAAPTVAQALALMPMHADLDLVLIDLHLPEIDGFEALISFGQSHPGVARVLISGQDLDADLIARAMRLGASGFIPKTLAVTEMVAAIAKVLDGDVYLPNLSPHQGGDLMEPATGSISVAQPHSQAIVNALSSRQVEVLQLVGRGRSNKDIARELSIAERTVKAHVSRIFEVLGAANRTQAVLNAQKLGLLAA